MPRTLTASSAPTRRTMKLSPLPLLCIAALLGGCATDKRLTVSPSEVFKIADDPVPDKPLIQASDERPRPLPLRQTTSSSVQLGGEEIRPDPASAFHAEVARLSKGFTRDAAAAKAFVGRTVRILDLSISFEAADVRDPRPGQQPVPEGVQPPAVEAFGAGVRTLGQATLGGSDEAVTLVVLVDGKRYVGVGRGRYTSNPGMMSTLWPFRAAVWSVLQQASAAGAPQAAAQ